MGAAHPGLVEDEERRRRLPETKKKMWPGCRRAELDEDVQTLAPKTP
jgi:hypothetical protein